MSAGLPTAVVPGSNVEAPEEAGEELPKGFNIGAYIVIRTIASGGCGTVYEAEHSVLGRRAALKVMHASLVDSSEMIERFVREARAVNTIRHPNIVDIVEFGRLPDARPYHVMELLEGQPLDEFVQSRGRLTVGELLEVLDPVCAALQAAHDCGVVHRDLKPSNVFVNESHGRRTIKLVDFGVAKLMEAPAGHGGLTMAGRKLGTPISMSPEQIRGLDVTHLADVYALGVLVYFCVTGTYPFDATSPEELERLHLSASPPAPSKEAAVSRSVDEVVLRCLAKEPSERFASALDVTRALRAAVTRTTTGDGQIRTSLAVALYVEVEIQLDAATDDDELLALEDVATILDTCTTELAGAGFTFPVSGGNALLAVRLIGEGEKQQAAADAIRRARGLAEQLVARPNAYAANHASISVHVDTALERQDAAGGVTLGGPILRVRGWAASAPLPEVHVTTGAARASSAG